MTVTERFTLSLAGGMEDALCIHSVIEHHIDHPHRRIQMLCSILSILWSMPVLFEMHSILIADDEHCGDCNGGPCYGTPEQGDPTKCEAAIG